MTGLYIGVGQCTPVGIEQLDQRAGPGIDQPGLCGGRNRVRDPLPARIGSDRRPGLHGLEQMHHRIGAQQAVVQHPAVGTQQPRSDHGLACADRFQLATGAAQRQQCERLLIGIGAFVQRGPVRGRQDAEQAVIAGEGGGQGLQRMIPGLTPRSGPAQLAGLGIDPGLPRGDPGPARALDRPAVLTDLLETAALVAIKPDLPPERQGVVEQPALEAIVEGENAVGGQFCLRSSR